MQLYIGPARAGVVSGTLYLVAEWISLCVQGGEDITLLLEILWLL